MTHKPGWMGLIFDGYSYNWAFENAAQLTNISYNAGFYNYRVII